ncbi:MAG: hypothetical protein Q9202_005698 [Teloschistes flavicans]
MTKGPSGRESTSTLDTSIDALWGAFRPLAISLRDVIMFNSTAIPSASPAPATNASSTPSPVIPPIHTRRAACTHLTMKRLYGQYVCLICRQPSSWGWVYCCTQDESSDPETAAPRDSLPDKPAWTADLAPWMQKAIAQGQYTGEQVEKLVAQRQKVLVAISASEAHFKGTQETSSSNHTSLRNSLSTPVTANATTLDTSSTSLFPIATETPPPTPSVLRQSIDSSISPKKQKPRIFPYCKYRACQGCRPAYRDRTWQVFHEVFATESLPPELTNGDQSGPPVSDITQILNLGVREPKRPKRPGLKTHDSLELYDADDEGRRRPKTPYTSRSPDSALARMSGVDLTDRSTEAVDTKGFRDSVKKAFKGMLINSRKRESGSSKQSKTSKRESGVQQWKDPAEFDLGLWKELTEELLKEAAEIPLPDDGGSDWQGTEASVEGTESVESREDDAEIKVKGGVAITEEAVETGTADIIMSV